MNAMLSPRRPRARRALLTLLPALLAATAATAVHAGLVACNPPSGGFTVFLSEPEFTRAAFTNNEDMRDFMKRLTKQLDDGQDRRWAHSPNPNPEVRYVNCVGRAPLPTGQDFIGPVVDTMYGRRVLLEIWGQLDAPDGGGGLRMPSAEMRVLLVPMKYAANRNETVPVAAMQRLDYAAPAPVPRPDFVNLLARPRDIEAFVNAALGFKLLRERSHELAHRNLCYASAQLQQLEKRQPAGRVRDDIAALRGFVLASAAKAVVAVQKTPPPAGGPPVLSRLTLQDPADPCAQEVEP
ncbi:MAG: hypothetical protein C0505_10960 [Leptothrix sp. (in: Bacteria)]|nr:hypothetical protein [Leptothrix sp. (in: b-proteobacteria)]